MRILTWNVNGLRAAIRKGFERHIERLQPDVMMLQEVRALPEQLPDAWRAPKDWHVLWHPAEKKGYSGVATFSRTPLQQLGTGIDDADDPEGRVLFARTGTVDLLNIYLPSGSSSDAAQAKKNQWLNAFTPFAAALRRRAGRHRRRQRARDGASQVFPSLTVRRARPVTLRPEPDQRGKTPRSPARSPSAPRAVFTSSAPWLQTRPSRPRRPLNRRRRGARSARLSPVTTLTSCLPSRRASRSRNRRRAGPPGCGPSAAPDRPPGPADGPPREPRTRRVPSRRGRGPEPR